MYQRSAVAALLPAQQGPREEGRRLHWEGALGDLGQEPQPLERQAVRCGVRRPMSSRLSRGTRRVLEGGAALYTSGASTESRRGGAEVWQLRLGRELELESWSVTSGVGDDGAWGVQTHSDRGKAAGRALMISDQLVRRNTIL
ncbi:hypothetical protein DFH09DRAFT_1114228 [Mycena vulgaris]|nr:hypothetical protein DFH09DRAFT_1114228 [Mycena vulgaris]